MDEQLVANPIIKAAGLRSGQRVLEIGFRQVKAMMQFAELVGDRGSVTGIDVNPDHVAKAQMELDEDSRTNIHVVEGSILDLPFPEGSFDIVFCLGVLHEIGDLNQAFREIARILHPDGRVVIADFRRFSRLKFAIYCAHVRLQGNPCQDVHPGLTHHDLSARVKSHGLHELSYETLSGEWKMGFIRSQSFLLVASKGLS